MAKDSDRSAGKLGTENTGGVLSGFLAEENVFDRRALWRLGSWGAAAVGAVTVAALANQSALGLRRDQLAAADFARQAQQLQLQAKEGQNEARRLASAVDTLNDDRDRLYSRVTVLEQGLDSVTGSLARQNLAAASSPQAPSQQAAAKPPAADAPPAVAPVSTTAAPMTEKARVDIAAPAPAQSQPPSQPSQPAAQAAAPAPAAAAALPKVISNVPTEPLTAPKSIMGPPDPAASKLIEPAKTANAPASPGDVAAAAPAPANEADSAEGAASKVQRTEFAVDLGSANSVGGLRALWRGLLKGNAELASLQPIIVVKERSGGPGMQLRLAAGPLSDAAAAAKICAVLVESERGCETTVFDGQRLSLQAEEKPEPAPSAAAKHSQSRRSTQKRTRREEPPPVPAAKPESSSTLSSLFGRR